MSEVDITDFERRREQFESYFWLKLNTTTHKSQAHKARVIEKKI
jgi:hypothetical protein